MRSHAGNHIITNRDLNALTIIVEQMTLSLDHLRYVLGEESSRAATNHHRIAIKETVINAYDEPETIYHCPHCKQLVDEGAATCNTCKIRLSPPKREFDKNGKDLLPKPPLLGTSGEKAGFRALSESATRQVIERWRAMGLVYQKKILSSTPIWIWPTEQGLKELDLKYKPWTPRVGALAHVHAINHIRLLWEKEFPADDWVSERVLRAEGEKGHIPDAVAWRCSKEDSNADYDHNFAIEVELTPKKVDRTVKIMQTLLHDYNQTIYYVSRRAESTVNEAISKLTEDQQKMIKAFPLRNLFRYKIIA